MIQSSNGALKALFYAFVTIAVLIGLWLNIEPYACPIPDALLTTPQAPKSWCFEFWLNRYQTLIGAAAALFAGVLAWRGAMRQVGKADDQINLITKQFAVDKIDSIYSKLVLTDGLCGTLNQFQNFDDRAIDIITLIANESVVVCDLIRGDEDPRQHIGDVIEPLGREFIQKADGLGALAKQIEGYTGSPYLPEKIKSALKEFVPEASRRAEYISAYVQRMKSNIHSGSYRDGLLIEYSKISDLRTALPAKINFDDRAAYVGSKLERDRLRELRDAAEAAAEL